MINKNGTYCLVVNSLSDSHFFKYIIHSVKYAEGKFGVSPDIQHKKIGNQFLKKIFLNKRVFLTFKTYILRLGIFYTASEVYYVNYLIYIIIALWWLLNKLFSS